MWGTRWRQRFRLAPLYGAMVAADQIARITRRSTRHPRRAAWREGLTIVIPDRDAPEMLAGALDSLRVALAAVREPHQIIVVANGASRETYSAVHAQFPEVEFIHSATPLGFAAAIELGLAKARHDGTYLMNNDMTLDAEALSAVLSLRAPDVFAVASQILQRDATGRREETGFTDWYIDRTGVHLFHVDVPSGLVDRPHLCASGGAALFRTEPLQRYLRASRCYDPFYWEDVDWSVAAWRDGLRVLFCPRSRAAHRRRATTARFYPAAEIDRIIERNRLLFDARHAVTKNGRGWLMDRICELPYASQRELARFPQAMGVLRRRVTCARAPQPAAPPVLACAENQSIVLPNASYSYRFRSQVTGPAARPGLMVVTPFAAFPPRHGGARRVAELVRGLSTDFDIVLISDEASLYDARSFAHFNDLRGVHLVQRERDPGHRDQEHLGERMRTHCHPVLIAAVAEALRRYEPALVQVEHAELAALIQCRGPGQRWILGLHDAYRGADFQDARDAGNFAARIHAYDAVTVCSDEDRALVSHPRVTCIPNGSSAARDAYAPSVSSQVLFVGPFRYTPNRDGILRFLRDAWPAIRTAVPAATLLVLGGDEHAASIDAEPAFAQPGVTVVGHRDDVPYLLAHSALTINPLSGIRGSAVKLSESLAAGRVCISTEEGARGFRDRAPPGLVTVPNVAGMRDPIIELLLRPDLRHRLEATAVSARTRHCWSHGVHLQKQLYETLLQGAVR